MCLYCHCWGRCGWNSSCHISYQHVSNVTCDEIYFPVLVLQWHPVLNWSLTLCEVCCSVYWHCQTKHFVHHTDCSKGGFIFPSMLHLSVGMRVEDPVLTHILPQHLIQTWIINCLPQSESIFGERFKLSIVIRLVVHEILKQPIRPKHWHCDHE